MSAVALLTGTHTNKVDAKRRVSVPEPFRAALLKQSPEGSGVYVYRSYKYDCLEACSEAQMERIAASLDDMDMFSDEQDDLVSTILADAIQLGFDSTGRVVLPKELQDFAGLDGMAAFVGRGRTFQIWNPDAFKAVQEEARSRARNRGATLRLKSSAEKAEEASQ